MAIPARLASETSSSSNIQLQLIRHLGKHSVRASWETFVSVFIVTTYRLDCHQLASPTVRYSNSIRSYYCRVIHYLCGPKLNVVR